MNIKITKKQNALWINGVKYVAEDGLEEYCDGCAFMSVGDCSGFPCQVDERKDGRNVIFVKKEGQK